MSIAAFFIILKTWHPEFLSIGEWISEWWYIHKIKYYEAIERSGQVVTSHNVHEFQ